MLKQYMWQLYTNYDSSIRFLIGAFLFCFSLAACSVSEIGPPGEDGVSDLQIRLPLGNQIKTSLETDTIFTDSAFDLIKFNKNNYALVDSIVFVSQLRSADSTTNCIVELFNVTDNALISNALLSTNSTEFVWLETNNIFDFLPSFGEVTLGVRVRSDNPNVIVEGGQSFLFLYRDSSN